MAIISQDHDINAKQLSDIAIRAYQQYVDAIGKPPAPMTADYQYHLDNDIIVTAKQDDIIIGFAIVIEKKDGFWLETIAIHPDHSGQGIGTSLMSSIEAYLRPKTDHYQLYTNEVMIRAQSWYKQLGFRETSRHNASGFMRIYYQKSL